MLHVGAGSSGEKGILRRFLLLEVQAVLAAVGEQRDAAGALEPLLASVQVLCGAESRVGFKSHSLGFLESCKPGCYARKRRHEHSPERHIREHYGVFYCLESADAGADHQVDLLYPQLAADDIYRADYVTHSKPGKIKEPGGACGRVDRRWAGRAVARAQHVDAEYEIFFRVEKFPGTDQVRPPSLGITARGQGVEDQDDLLPMVPSRGAVVCYVNARENASSLAPELPVISQYMFLHFNV